MLHGGRWRKLTPVASSRRASNRWLVRAMRDRYRPRPDIRFLHCPDIQTTGPLTEAAVLSATTSIAVELTRFRGHSLLRNGTVEWLKKGLCPENAFVNRVVNTYID
jgi:hypothetical protein